MSSMIIIRHGETPANAGKKIAGRGTDPYLNEAGINQVHQAGQQLYKKFGNNIDFMVISGMKRTNQTGDILNQYLNIGEVYYDKELQEKDYGELEGKSFEEAMPIILSLPDNESPVGGESAIEFSNRITKSFCNFFKEASDILGIAVVHGHVGRVLNEKFLDSGKHFNNCEFQEIASNEIIDFAGKCNLSNYNICTNDEC